jgi:soluble lytic murein transglycosylase
MRERSGLINDKVDRSRVLAAPNERMQRAPRPSTNLAPPEGVVRPFRFPVTAVISLVAAVAGAQEMPLKVLPADDEAFTPAQLESFFSNGVLAEARHAYVMGRYRRVQELLEADETLPARFLKAMSLVRSGLHAEAGQAMARLADDWGDLRDRFSFEAGKAFARARWTDEARRQFEAVDANSLSFAHARFELSTLRLAQRDVEGAIEALNPLVEGSHGTATVEERSKAVLEVAGLERRRGNAPRAQTLLLRAWATMPNSQAAAVAARTYEVRRAAAPIRLQRAESLLADHRNREALSMLATLPASKSPELTCQVAFLRAMALRKERRHVEVVSTLATVVDQCDINDRLRPLALYSLGYSQHIVDPAGSVATYVRLADEHPGHPLQDDAIMAAARLLSSRAEHTEALKLLTRISTQYPDGDQIADALFLRFWLLRERGQPENALLVLDELDRLPDGKYPGDPLRRARYWRGRTLEELGRDAESKAVLSQLASESIGSYYGFLARSRLSPGEWEAPVEAEVDDGSRFSVKAPELLAQRHFRAGVALMRLQERGGAGELFALNRNTLDEPSMRLLFHVYDFTRNEAHAGVVARAYLRRGFSARAGSSARRLYQAAYPLEFRDLIDRHSKKAGVDPDLMQALVREESGFQPKARSSTGALGLAQLMPATAWQVGRSLRLNSVSRRALLQPGSNLRLGSAYLGTLQRQFKGNHFHAVASYNAGPTRVNRWLKDFGDADSDEWVEQIPIDETREYVKKVLGSYSAYDTLTAPP